MRGLQWATKQTLFMAERREEVRRSLDEAALPVSERARRIGVRRKCRRRYWMSPLGRLC